MSEQLHEQISAFVDGELPEHETELLLRRLERDAELQRAYVRFVAIGASLRREPMGTLTRGGAANGSHSDLVARVRAAVALENAQHGAPSQGVMARHRRWLRPLAGAAVAATVAGVAILGVQQLQSRAQQGAPQVAAAVQQDTSVIGNPDSTEPPSYIVPPASNERRAVPAARLTNYVVAHSEYSSLGRRNVLSGIIAEDPTPLEEPGTSETPAAPKP